MLTLAVDAMGGDKGLDVTIPGCKLFLKNIPEVDLILVGNSEEIKAKLTQCGLNSDKIRIHHASEVVDMGENPQSALKNKKDSSMRVAIDLVHEGKAKAAISAGNTGALIATAKFVLKTLPGINRPAIATFLPGLKDKQVCALDLGANVNSTPAYLVQFALLGSELYKMRYPHRTHPRVALMNIGTEAIKGNAITKETYDLLSRTDLNFIGNVEGNDLFTHRADVIVCDGFVGNIQLKPMEGSMHFVSTLLKQGYQKNWLTKIAALLSHRVFQRIKEDFDPRAFNGATILGLNGIVVKSHGGTDAYGFSCALKKTYTEVSNLDLISLETTVSHQLSKLDILAKKAI